MSDCSHGDVPVIGLINIWFPVERMPPPLSLYQPHHGGRMGSGHCEYQVADWGCHSGPQWTLVARCACPLVSAAGSVSWVCEGFVGADRRRRWGGFRAECCPSLGPATHTVFFSLHHCHRTADDGVWWLDLAYGSFFSSWNKYPHNARLWLTTWDELVCHDITNIG